MADSIKFSFILSERRSSPVKAANADTNARLPASPPNAMAAHSAKLSIGDGKAAAALSLLPVGTNNLQPAAPTGMDRETKAV
jgi:hypothetical protein